MLLPGAAVIMWAAPVPSMRDVAARRPPAHEDQVAAGTARASFLGSWDATVAIYEFQKSVNYVRVPLIQGDDEDSIQEELMDRIHDGDNDRVIVATPQPDDDHLSFLSLGKWILEGGYVPALIDARHVGGQRFMYLARDHITIEDVRDAMGQDWISSAQVWMGCGGTPMNDGDVYGTWMGMLITITPRGFGAPLLENVNVMLQHRQDWARDLEFSGLPRDRPRQDKMGIVGWQASSSVADWPADASWAEVQRVIGHACSLDTDDFDACSCARPISFLSFRGYWIPAVYGVMPRSFPMYRGIFVDARDLGAEVRLLWLDQVNMTIDEVLAAADIQPPRGWLLQVEGGLEDPGPDGRLVLGHRTVLAIKVSARQAASEDDLCREQDQTDPPDSDDAAGGDDRHTFHRDDCAAASGGEQSERRSRSPRRGEGAGTDAPHGANEHTVRMEIDMWKEIYMEDANSSCLSPDTSIQLPIHDSDYGDTQASGHDASNGCALSELRSLLELSPPGDRRAHLLHVWQGLRSIHDINKTPTTEDRC